MILKKVLFASAALGSVFISTGAMAQAEPYIGQLMLVPYNFCPNGWLPASGQILPIQNYSALFSLLGTTYGGDGRTTFALPDMRGRFVNSAGQGPGLPNYTLGQVDGATNVTLLSSQMPAHTHLATSVAEVHVQPTAGDRTSPVRSSIAISPTNNYSSAEPAINQMKPGTVTVTTTVGAAGGNQPVSVQNPYLTLQYCIALQGIYPSRP